MGILTPNLRDDSRRTPYPCNIQLLDPPCVDFFGVKRAMVTKLEGVNARLNMDRTLLKTTRSRGRTAIASSVLATPGFRADLASEA